MKTPIRIILLGPPGAGKGTQARFLSERLGVPHISSGDILRKEIEKDTELGRETNQYASKGLLVPDELIIRIISQFLDRSDYRNGFILDGFPRTVEQAEKLQLLGFRIDAVLLIEIDDSMLIQRLTGRRSCPKCWRMFHQDLNPPQKPGVCDDCNVDLIVRDDDKEETVKRRIDVYHEKTQPLIAFYRMNPDINLIHLHGQNAIGAPEKIHSSVMLRLQKLFAV